MKKNIKYIYLSILFLKTYECSIIHLCFDLGPLKLFENELIDYCSINFFFFFAETPPISISSDFQGNFLEIEIYSKDACKVINNSSLLTFPIKKHNHIIFNNLTNKYTVQCY